ncbi:MAG: DUF6056 family protein [Bryobacterales bacterium]
MHRESEPAYLPWAKWISVAAHLAVAGLACSLFVFAAPLADDYCTPANPQSLFDYVANLYRTWSGRWFSHGIERFVLTHVDFTQAYGLLTAALSLLCAAGVWVVARSVFRRSVSPWLVGSLSCSFVVVFWCLHPSLGQGFYWFTGAVEYQLVVALSLGLLAALLSETVAVSRGVVRALLVLGLSLLAFLITGMHELFAAMLCLVLAVGAAVAFRIQHRNRWLWVIVLVAGVAGFCFAAAAPGNLVRSASFAGDTDWLLALWLAFWQAIKAATKWAFDLKLLAATVVFLVDPRIRAARPDWLNPAAPWKWIVALTWLALLAVGFAVPSFAMGQEMPGRALGGIFLVFLLGWFLTLFVWTRDLRLPAGIENRDLRKIASACLLLLSLSIVTTGNARHAIHDLTHTAPAWKRAMVERYELIRDGARGGIVVISVPPAPPRPRTFFQGPADITSDWKDWKNGCMAGFFDVPAVRVSEQ